MRLSVDAGTLKEPVAYERYTDERFARAAAPAQILL
jgi:NitT/TauT family transport system substrate-binding protein